VLSTVDSAQGAAVKFCHPILTDEDDVHHGVALSGDPNPATADSKNVSASISHST
jgi:hypothetical protein